MARRTLLLRISVHNTKICQYASNPPTKIVDTVTLQHTRSLPIRRVVSLGPGNPLGGERQVTGKQRDVVRALRRAKIVRHLPDAKIEWLASCAHCRDYPAGSSICTCEELILVTYGHVDVVLSSPGGRALREARYGPGALLWTRAESEWGPSPAMCAGVNGAVVCGIVSDSLVDAVQGTPAALREMLSWQNEDLRHRERFAAVKALYSLRGQIALHLADLALLDPERVVYASHAELALDLGCSRPHLSEHLSDFRARGLIEYGAHTAHPGGIVVHDLEALLRASDE
jgi:CRP-like cAMP-binding protein